MIVCNLVSGIRKYYYTNFQRCMYRDYRVIRKQKLAVKCW